VILPQIVHAACALAALAGERPIAAAPAPAQEPGWTFDAFIYYWSAGLSGELTVDGQDIDLEGGDDGFSGETDLSGFLGDFEAHRGPWTCALAPIFVNLETTGDQSAAVAADVEIRARIHEGFVARDLGRSWEWLAGARYYELDTAVDLSAGGVPSGSSEDERAWVDPIVGARYHPEFGDWSLRARADVGGFGVGSDLAWNASALVGYRFSRWCSIQAGYRVLSLDFSSDSERVAYDLTMKGPVLGVTFSF
jgi:hypothetical protein